MKDAQITVRLPVELVAQLDASATNEGVKRSTLVRMLLRLALSLRPGTFITTETMTKYWKE